MRTGRTEDLIAALAAAAAPVRVLPPLGVRLARWLAVAVAAAAAGVWIFGPRADLDSAVRDAGFIGDLALMLATGLLAAAAAFGLSVPGAERSPLRRAWPLAALLAWAAFLAWRFAAGGGSWTALVHEPWHPACAARILLVAAAPAGVVFAMVRRAAPLRPLWTAALASLASLAIAAVPAQIVCPLGGTAHLLVAHLMPLLAFTTVGTVAGAAILRPRLTGLI